MSDAAGAKALDLGRKLVSAERALAAIRAGSRIYVGTGCAAPRGLLAKLEAMVPGPPDLESKLRHNVSSAASGGRYTYSLSASGVFRRQRSARVGGQRPTRLRAHLAGGGTGTSGSGRLPIDVALLQVSPPDARGFVSLGVSVDLAPAVLSVARSVIAEVNPAMPRTCGDSAMARLEATGHTPSVMTSVWMPRSRRSLRWRNASVGTRPSPICSVEPSSMTEAMSRNALRDLTGLRMQILRHGHIDVH